MMLQRCRKPIWTFKKKHFSNLDDGLFLARIICSILFVSKLLVRKMFVGVQGIFWYILEHHTMCTSYFTAGESDYYRFWGNLTLMSSEANMKLQKKLFSNLDKALFLAPTIYFMNFMRTLHTCNMFIRLQGIFWYNLDHHTMCGKDCMAGESDFCRF